MSTCHPGAKAESLQAPEPVPVVGARLLSDRPLLLRRGRLSAVPEHPSLAARRGLRASCSGPALPPAAASVQPAPAPLPPPASLHSKPHSCWALPTSAGHPTPLTPSYSVSSAPPTCPLPARAWVSATHAAEVSPRGQRVLSRPGHCHQKWCHSRPE